MSGGLLLLVLASSGAPTSVIVYPDRARVTRVAEVRCPSAKPVVFEDIPPWAALASVRARADGALVEDLTLQRHSREASFGAEAQKLEGALRAVEQEVAADTDRLALTEARLQLSERFAAVSRDELNRDLALPHPDTRAWSQAFDISLNGRLAASAEEVAVKARLRDEKRRLEELRAGQRTLAASASREVMSAEVKIRCTSDSAVVRLSYVVGGVSWTPVYEAHADESNGLVEFVSLATLQQVTGEDWRAVELVLSTAIPFEDAQPPQVKRLELSAVEQPAQKKVLVRRADAVEHAESGQLSTASTGAADMRAVPEGLSVQLVVPDKADVKGDGTAARVRVARTRMRAKYSLLAQPNLQPTVYRVAEVTNDAPFPLLPGEMDVFGASGFIGRLRMDRVASGAPFRLTFGVDDTLRMSRDVLQEVKRAEGLFKDRMRFEYAYRFLLRNPGGRAATVDVSDHIPVSELADISVALDADTTAGFIQRPADGILTWVVKVPAASERVVVLHFHVDVPRSYDLTGL
jgi:uncharacterized protein (TIGR02231 family)